MRLSERHFFLLGYLGSAALVAFVAACLAAPRVSTFACDVPGGEGDRQCVLAETWSSADEASTDKVSVQEAINRSVALAVSN